MTNKYKIDTEATWTDILTSVSNLGFRRLGNVSVTNKHAIITFDSAVGHHEVELAPTETGSYLMIEHTNGVETDRRVLTTAMLRFIPTHIQIAYRSIGVK